MTDASGAVIWQRSQMPFGGTVSETGAGTNKRFPGQWFDAESGLHYNYFRDYDPTTGRYVESDPFGLVAGINTYAYVAGNPLSYVDPTGEFVFLIPPAITAAEFIIGAVAVALGANELGGIGGVKKLEDVAPATATAGPNRTINEPETQVQQCSVNE